MTGDAARAVLALGSNLGDREATIRAAVMDLDAAPRIRVVSASGLVESGAVKLTGPDDSAPRYLNAAVLIETTMTPLELLDAVNAIEARHGRERHTVWGDRTLDIDLITFGDAQLHGHRLTLPHPRAWQRAFVLAPWLQVDADAVIPGRGPVAELLAGIEDEVWEFPAEPLAGAATASPAGKGAPE